jgi:UDP-glucuronate 4-epimerase
LADGNSVVGLDNINSYYSPKLKHARLSILARDEKFQFAEFNLAHAGSVADLFAQYQFAYVLHLAGQPSVRYSIENPQAYAESNLLGFSQRPRRLSKGGVEASALCLVIVRLRCKHERAVASK